jgi:hypothetical protein
MGYQPQGYLQRRFIMRAPHDLAENVWYGAETAINVARPCFSCAGRDNRVKRGGFLRPRRVRCFKQRPRRNKRLRLFRAADWAGESGGQERTSGVHALQTVLGLSPAGGEENAGILHRL